MSRTNAIVERTSGAVPVLSATEPPPNSLAYAELAMRLFGGIDARKVIAFTSANSREGVTRAVRGVAAELVRAGRRTAVLDGALGLERALSLGTPASDCSVLDRLTNIRDTWDCVLVDCGSLERGLDFLRLAPMSDGVVVVVEAGRTSRDQVERAANLVREIGGTLLGCVLNKRRYPIPGWLYRLFWVKTIH